MKPGRYSTTFLGLEIPVIYVTDATTAEQILVRIRNQQQELISIDTETEALPQYRGLPDAALSPHLSRVRLLQIFTGRTAIVFDCKLIGRDEVFTQFLEERRFVGHNSVFDLQYFYRWFGCKKVNIGCTYLLAKLLIHATRPTDDTKASLAALVNSFFKAEILKEMQRSDWSIPELTWEQVEYSALDAICTYKLAEKLSDYISKYSLERIYKLYKDAQHPIVKMQLNGISLDVDKHRDLIVSWRADLYKAKKEVQALTNLSYLTSTTLANWLEKSLPPETLALWPRTDTGKLQTDSHVFAEFDYLPIVKPFSEYQKREKLCTSFGNTLINQINPETNRLHAQYKLAGARTGRLSCSSPNLQQLPRDSSVRANFIPEVGKVFLCADYSQIEIRVGAELSRDTAMLKAYRDGVDLHKLTASLISHKSIKDVTKEDRQKAKAFNFGLMFGLGAKKFSHYAKKSYGAEVSKEEAEAGVKTFRDAYSGYRQWQLNQSSFAAEKGYVTTPCGKRRCLDRDKSYGASMNSPIQGGAAECMLYALIRLNKSMTSDASVVISCHDELVIELNEKNLEENKHALEQAMIGGFLDVFPNGVTNKLVEAKSGNSWATAKA